MKQTTFLLLLGTGCWVFGSSCAYGQSSEEQIIAHAKKIHVSSLDSTLSAQRIEAWLRSLAGARAILTWETNDCGEQTGVPGDGSNINPPICAEIHVQLADNRSIGIQIVVGTFKGGITGEPQVFFIYVREGDSTRSLRNLRDIPTWIRAID